MYKPKITVVSVCYNVASDLAKTIESVSKQTYDDIEYIVIDGASTDNTVDLIKQNYSIVSKWISEPDKGIYDAMNKGIDLATGEWIIFMNAGDVFHNSKVIEDVFSKDYLPDVKLIYGDVMLDFGILGLLPKKLGRVSRETVPYEICHQSVFTRSDILKKLHYDINFKICSDCNSFAEIYRRGYTLEYVPVFISRFDVVGGVSSRKIMRAYFEHCKIMQINPYSIKYLPNTCKTYVKSVLLRFLSEEKYNQMRYNSVKSRTLYQ